MIYYIVYVLIGALLAGFIYHGVKNETEDDEVTIAVKLIGITMVWPIIIAVFAILAFGLLLKGLVDRIK